MVKRYRAKQAARRSHRIACAAMSVVLAIGMAPGLAFAGEGDKADGAGAADAPRASLQLAVQAQPAEQLAGQAQGDYALTYAYDSGAKTAIVTGFTGTAGGNLVVPATVVKDGATYTVTAIGASAFKNAEGETGFDGTLSLPNTVKSIGASAFQNCQNLQGPLVLPSGLTSLGSYAFADCRGMAGTVTIPAGVTAIPDHCFFMDGSSGDRGLTGIAFANGSSLASIGESAFEGNWHITGGINLPDSVTSIGARAFCNTGAREYDFNTGEDEPAGAQGALHLPANLQTIGAEAFYVCTFSGDLVIPSGIASIGKGAFHRSGFTGSLTLPEGMTTVPEECFYDCDFTGSLTLPSTLASIGESAFGGCNTFSGNLEIPSGVTQISDWAFSGFGAENALCGSLTLPSGLTSIGESAFSGAGFTGALNIPDSVASIGEEAFSGCCRFSSLKLPNNPNFTAIPNGAFAGSSDDPMGFGGTLSIPSSVASIDEKAFYYCSFLEKLQLPSSLTDIGTSAFEQCTLLSGTLALPSNLKTVGADAFYFCQNLTGLTIPSGVSSIGERAFYGCLKAGGDLTIPGSVKTIGKAAFERFGDSEGVQPGVLTIEGGVESIGESAFDSCKGFTSAIIPDSVAIADMGANVFMFCENLKSCTLPDAWTAVPEGVFYGCSSLEQIVIPASATSIGNNAFRLCTGIVGALTIPEGVTDIGSAAFYGCENLTGALVIPASVASFGTNYLGDGIFEGCKGFTSLQMNQACTTLPNSMFEGCTGLTGNVTIPSTVTKIETNVFRNCSGLNGTLTIPSSVTTISGTPFYGTNFATIQNDSDATLNVSDITPAYNVDYQTGSAGDGTIGQGTYTRVVGEPIDITNNADIAITAPDQTYDGTEKTHLNWMGTSLLVVKYNGKTLTRNVHYRADYINNVNAGTATVTIVGLEQGGFNGSQSLDFTIKPKSITPTVELSQYSYAYDGTAKTPGVTVKDGSTVIDSANYDVVISDNVERGAASVAVTLKGNYIGSKTAYFYIQDGQVVTATDKTVQAGKTVALNATTTGDGMLWYESSDEGVATVDYNGVVTGMKAGTATITITAGETASYAAASTTAKVTVTAAPTPTPTPDPSPAQKKTQTITAVDKTVQAKKTISLGAKTSAGGALSYKSSNTAVATVDAKGVVTGKKAGIATITITAAATMTHAAATKAVTITVKNANTLKTKAQSKKLALKTVKKKAQAFKASVIKTKAQGKVAYAKKKVTAKYKKYVAVSKGGAITVKKGAPKGKCVLTLSVKAAGTSKYMPATKTAKVTITIK